MKEDISVVNAVIQMDGESIEDRENIEFIKGPWVPNKLKVQKNY